MPNRNTSRDDPMTQRSMRASARISAAPAGDAATPESLIRQVGRRGRRGPILGRGTRLPPGPDRLDPVDQVEPFAVGIVVEVGPAAAGAQHLLDRLALAPLRVQLVAA